MPSQTMKVSKSARRWLVVALTFIVSVVGLVFGYYYSWAAMTPGMDEHWRKHYDLLSRMVGLPSLALFVASIAGAVWLGAMQVGRARRDRADTSSPN
jgi:hypothetical protein